MGTHAKPRRRVRSAALGTLAVGATLTGVGLTAAALDPSGAVLADGTFTGDPVNFAASGLGTPVPVADVSSLDGSSVGGGAVMTKSGNTGGAGGLAAVTPSGGFIPTVSIPSTEAVLAKRVKSTVTGSRRNAASVRSAALESNAAPANDTAAGNSTAAGNNTAPRTSGASGKSPAVGTSSSPAAVPSLDASLPISTALPVPALPTIASLTTAMNHAKSTVAGLLGEVAGLV